jgi:hypothetical protein
MVIEVDSQNIRIEQEDDNIHLWTWYIPIPILPAFSVEYFTIQAGGVNAITVGEIRGDKVILPKMHLLYPDWKSIHVVIHYHGIRDYGLLFPWVTDRDLRKRIGEFYEESEKNFEQGAWLSFALMCGAVFEGILYAKLMPQRDRNSFEIMIKDAYSNAKILDDKQRNTMNRIRRLRNLVHVNKFKSSYIKRKDAMDIRATMDELIKKF